MGKRKCSEEEAERIKKKLKKWQKRLKKNEDNKEEERSITPSSQTAQMEGSFTPDPSTLGEDSVLVVSDEEIPEELLLALGPEGADTKKSGEPIHQQLASRWVNIMREGLKKETREDTLNKYPAPENFPAAAPVLNPEIKAIMSNISIKRDNRFVWRQNLTRKMLSAIGKALTNLMKGNINSKDMVEHLNNAAKMGAELFHQDSLSRRYFALSGTTPVVKDAIKNEKPDDMLFGKNCSEIIKSTQTIQKTGAQIRDKKKNFKSPLPTQQQPRSGQSFHPRGGQSFQPRSYQTKPHQRQPYNRTVQKSTPQRKRSPPHKPRYRN